MSENDKLSTLKATVSEQMRELAETLVAASLELTRHQSRANLLARKEDYLLAATPEKTLAAMVEDATARDTGLEAENAELLKEGYTAKAYIARLDGLPDYEARCKELRDLIKASNFLVSNEYHDQWKDLEDEPPIQEAQRKITYSIERCQTVLKQANFAFKNALSENITTTKVSLPENPLDYVDRELLDNDSFEFLLPSERSALSSASSFTTVNSVGEEEEDWDAELAAEEAGSKSVSLGELEEAEEDWDAELAAEEEAEATKPSEPIQLTSLFNARSRNGSLADEVQTKPVPAEPAEPVNKNDGGGFPRL